MRFVSIFGGNSYDSDHNTSYRMSIKHRIRYTVAVCTISRGGLDFPCCACDEWGANFRDRNSYRERPTRIRIFICHTHPHPNYDFNEKEKGYFLFFFFFLPLSGTQLLTKNQIWLHLSLSLSLHIIHSNMNIYDSFVSFPMKYNNSHHWNLIQQHVQFRASHSEPRVYSDTEQTKPHVTTPAQTSALPHDDDLSVPPATKKKRRKKNKKNIILKKQGRVRELSPVPLSRNQSVIVRKWSRFPGNAISIFFSTTIAECSSRFRSADSDIERQGGYENPRRKKKKK